MNSAGKELVYSLLMRYQVYYVDYPAAACGIKPKVPEKAIVLNVPQIVTAQCITDYPELTHCNSRWYYAIKHVILNTSWWFIYHEYFLLYCQITIDYQHLLRQYQDSTLRRAHMPRACRSCPRFSDYVPDWASDFSVWACTNFPSSMHKLYRASTNIGWARENFCRACTFFEPRAPVGR